MQVKDILNTREWREQRRRNMARAAELKRRVLALANGDAKRAAEIETTLEEHPDLGSW